MHKITNILRTQAIDGRTAIWSECEKPTRSRESTGTESPRCPYEKGQEQILKDEIQELNRKGNLIFQENVELYKKVFGTTDMATTSRNAFVPLSYGMHAAGGNPQELVQLQLCQPEQEVCETSDTATK
ncbi:Agamous-like MADS-box protein AGL17 [Glycine soja]|uniref:Agamous-like MADS-box protein AGL17 n=1 Tax=Glycine soja TaxID=3848 RepID=A0A0B2P6E0_GLYSO|nr:Agamous-like MADS-box protein AGL17 [Glycine soja]